MVVTCVSKIIPGGHYNRQASPLKFEKLRFDQGIRSEAAQAHIHNCGWLAVDPMMLKDFPDTEHYVDVVEFRAFLVLRFGVPARKPK